MNVIAQTGELYPTPRATGNYDPDLVSKETALYCEDPSRTQQHFKDECDINVIVERFGVTGHLPIMAVQPMQGDFTGVDDFQSALEHVRASQENFMRLPAKVRERFQNNPQAFVDYCLNPANIEGVRELGLAPRPAAPGIIEAVKNGNPTEGTGSNPNPAT